MGPTKALHSLALQASFCRNCWEYTTIQTQQTSLHNITENFVFLGKVIDWILPKNKLFCGYLSYLFVSYNILCFSTYKYYLVTCQRWGMTLNSFGWETQEDNMRLGGCNGYWVVLQQEGLRDGSLNGSCLEPKIW